MTKNGERSTQSGHTQFAAICVQIPNNALIAAECAQLTGAAPDPDGFALCPRVDRIPDAAYIRMGLRVLGYGSTLDELVAAIAEATAERDFTAEAFRIEFRSLIRDDHIAPLSHIIALANVIPARPNLDHPRQRFVLLERANGLWFGEIVTEYARTYLHHADKPHRTSTSLDSRLARALVNLAAPPASTLIDPCCGTGSILLEACALGIPICGADKSWQAAHMSRANLVHFSYDATVEVADIGTLDRRAAALITDLPYGRAMEADETAIRTILEHGRELAPVAVYVAGYDISAWLTEAGYRDIEVYPVTKQAIFTRYVYRVSA